jgi:leucyl-tRNA synthetase
MVLAEDHRKMSKSWGNTINPDDVVKQYGADTLRMYEMFMAPFNMEIAWSTAALQGAHRFLKRVWSMYTNHQSQMTRDTSSAELVNKLNKTIQKVGDDVAETKFNTAIAAMMEFLNEWENAAGQKDQPALADEEAQKFLQILAPFAPFLTEKLWRDVFHKTTSIHISRWPSQTQVSIKETSVTVPVQINGKFRGTVILTGEANQQAVEQAARATEFGTKYLVGKTYKLIYVKGKIANFVVQ